MRERSTSRRLLAQLLAAALLLLAGHGPSAAQQQDRDDALERGNFAFGVIIGTHGLGGELAVRLHPNFIVRATGTVISESLVPFSTTGVQEKKFIDLGKTYSQGWDVKPSLLDAALLLDVHLFRDGGRITAGARYFTFDVDLKLNPSDPNHVKIGTTAYTATGPGASVSAKITNEQPFVPYAGIGYDSTFFKNYGLSISLDAGVMFGVDPSTKLSVVGFTPTADDRKRQEADLDKLTSWMRTAYPVFSLSAKYRY